MFELVERCDQCGQNEPADECEADGCGRWVCPSCTRTMPDPSAEGGEIVLCWSCWFVRQPPARAGSKEGA